MAFNPSLPANGSPDSSAEMRSQLTGLFDLIQAIPAGPQGEPGPPGGQGPEGPTGTQGPVGPAFTNFQATVTTLPASTPATVDATFNGTAVVLTFAIPQGEQGGQGDPGVPGEVTAAALDAAIATTALNPSALTPLTLTVSDPPTQAEVQAVADRLDALLAALQRV